MNNRHRNPPDRLSLYDRDWIVDVLKSQGVAARTKISGPERSYPWRIELPGDLFGRLDWDADKEQWTCHNPLVDGSRGLRTWSDIGQLCQLALGELAAPDDVRPRFALLRDALAEFEGEYNYVLWRIRNALSIHLGCPIDHEGTPEIDHDVWDEKWVDRLLTTCEELLELLPLERVAEGERGDGTSQKQ